MKRYVIVLLIPLLFLMLSQQVIAEKNTTAGEPTSTMTIEERMEHLGLIIPEHIKKRFEELNKQPPPALLNTEDVFDWRELGGVTPVKDQGNCGSCWDFAATGAFESIVLIADTIEWDLSEQQVLSCNTGGSNCGGGWMQDAYDLFMTYGAVEESCMPYEADDQVECYQDECVVMVTLEDVVDIPYNTNSIKNALMTGPLSTTFMVYSDFHWNCYWHEDTGDLNHAVLIVGWDDDMCDGLGGWMLKNSWGEGWGDDGFFYMPYNSCGIGNYTQLPVYQGMRRPELTYSPDSIVVNVPLGGQGSDILQIGNVGDGNLIYRLEISGPANQDAFGYFWYDSEHELGPDYNWIDITGIGEPVGFPEDLDDGNSGPIDIGFDFNFYGNTFNNICVCTNGWASFTDDNSVEYGNPPIPHPEPPNNMLAAFYDDLNLENQGAVYFYSNGADTAIISWVEAPDWREEGTFTFQIVLVAPEKIVYQYESMGPGRLNEATIGMENADGSVGLQVAYNEAFTTGEKAVEFTLGEPLDWLEIDNTNGIIDPDDNLDVEVSCSAGEHAEGTCRAVLKLSTNDPENMYVEIPVIMNIGTTSIDELAEVPVGFTLTQNFPNPFNASTSISYTLPTYPCSIFILRCPYRWPLFKNR